MANDSMHADEALAEMITQPLQVQQGFMAGCPWAMYSSVRLYPDATCSLTSASSSSLPSMTTLKLMWQMGEAIGKLLLIDLSIACLLSKSVASPSAKELHLLLALPEAKHDG